MKVLDLTFPMSEENLACDEALLEARERDGGEEVLRFWESPKPFVVLGYSNPTATEVFRDACAKNGVPILRRCTGGGSVVQGPGCLNYSLVLKISNGRPLTGITETNRFIMDANRRALEPLFGAALQTQGASDLTLGSLKISGNAQRRKRHWLLFHGTFLLDFDLPLIERLLPMPSRQPEYRHNRRHEEFLTNARQPVREIRERLIKFWDADGALTEIPLAQIRESARARYATAEWTFKS